MRRLLTLAAATAALLITAAPALACGGLIGPNGAVNLLRTTTFAGYHDGVEHYVTAFEFAGGGGAFGSIVPLPGVPTDVERGGDWTLQRLIRETDPGARGRVRRARRRGAAEERRGAARDQDRRARHHRPAGRRRRGRPVGHDHGFRLPPDAPEVLDFYAKRSPIFMAAALRRRRGRRARPGRRRRHAGPPDHPDRQPVGPAAHPRPRQDAAETGPGRRLPADRRAAGAAARPTGDLGTPGLSLDHSDAGQRRACSPTCGRTRAWSGSRQTAWLTKIGIDAAAGAAALRPGHRRVRPGRAVAAVDAGFDAVRPDAGPAESAIVDLLLGLALGLLAGVAARSASWRAAGRRPAAAPAR